jgi:hypothetical protein
VVRIAHPTKSDKQMKKKMKSLPNVPNPSAEPSRPDPRKLRLSIDRFEGDKKEIAVLLADDGTTINIPKRFLSRTARAGDILTLTLERDTAATKQLAAATRKVQAQLKKADPGGDIKI